MNKFVLLTLCLVFSSVLAHTSHRPHQVSDKKQDAQDFVKGFLKGISSDPIFDQIKTCIADSETFAKDVSQAIALIRTKNPEKVKQGIILLGQAAQIIPHAAEACQASQADIAKLVALAKAFTNPQYFFYQVGKSLIVNRVEVIHEINSAVKAYLAHDFTTLGYWVGKAMDTIFLGLNRPLRQELVDFLNKEQTSFKSELPEKFKGMTLAQIKAQFLGAIPESYEEEVENVFNYEGSTNDIPKEFDSAKHWPGCVHPIRDQGHCGSCWAFAASEVLSDRFCIASGKKTSVVLSPQWLVSCDTTNYACNGGIPAVAWRFVINNGLATDSCIPYASYNGTVPKCNTLTKCRDGSAIKKYYGAQGSLVQLANPTSIQQNIMQYGPVEAAFSVYEDFLSYKSGIYKHTSGSLLGGHAVKIVGWGNESGTNYWLIANSWGTSWGMSGFFKIAWGQCGIDKAVTAVQADLKRSAQTKISSRWH